MKKNAVAAPIWGRFVFLLLAMSFYLIPGYAALGASENKPSYQAYDEVLLQPDTLVPPYRDMPVFVEITEPSPPRDMSTEQKHARPYLIGARNSAMKGNSIEAIDVLRRGLELSPGNPDLLYALAWLCFIVQGNTHEALDILLQAQTKKDWYFTSWNKSIDFRCRLLFMMKKYSELESYLESGLLKARDPVRLYWGAALNKAGLQDTHTDPEALSIALRLYPEQARFMALKLSSGQGIDFSDAQWFQRYASKTPEYRAALALRIRSMGTSVEQRNAIHEYKVLGGKDPWVDAWALVNVLEGFDLQDPDLGESVLLSALSDPHTVHDIDVTLFVLKKLREYGRDTASFFSSDKATVLYRDLDRDSYPEERFAVLRAMPLLMACDTQQDGITEFILGFDSGVPSSVKTKTPEETITYQYSVYPELSRAILVTNSVSEEFVLQDRKLEIRILEVPDDGWIDPVIMLERMQVPYKIRFPSSANLLDESWSMIVRDKNTGSKSIKKIDEGVIFAAKNDSDGDGKYDTLELYDGGKLVMKFISTGQSEVYDRFVIMDSQVAKTYMFFAPADRLRYKLHSRKGLAVWDVNKDQSLDYFELSKLVHDTQVYFEANP